MKRSGSDGHAHETRLKRAMRLALTNLREGRLREATLSRLLLALYQSQSRRHWRNSVDEDQHYFVHAPQLLRIFTGESGEILYAYTRAFLTAEIIRPGASVLDIGCGDGSLTKRFYAVRASHVDAIDIEESAIAYATKFNSAPNIAFRRLDAVAEPFPRSRYDVIVFD